MALRICNITPSLTHPLTRNPKSNPNPNKGGRMGGMLHPKSGLWKRPWLIGNSNTYLGILDYRLLLYTICLFVFSCLGLLIKKYETVPLIFMFILGNDIEGVFFRQMLI